MESLEKKSIFESDFDMERYIDNRLLEIEDLEERVSTRALLTGVFSELYEHMREEYGKLESNMQKEEENTTFHIFMGIIKKELYDLTDEAMFPMIADELEPTEISSKNIKESMDQHVPVHLYSVFVKADYQTVCKICEAGKQFPATVYTSEGEFPGVVSLKKADRYEKLLKELYSYFQLNGLCWNTVCTAYISKMLDVFLEEAQYPKEADVLEVKVDFKEFEPYICYDYIPLWNIKKATFITDMRPVPCVDKVHFEHYINGFRLDKDCQYLIAEPERHILRVLRQEDLMITCLEEESVKWNVYQIANVIKRKYEEKVFESKICPGAKKLIRTKAAIEHYVGSLGFEQIAALVNIELLEEDSIKGQSPGTYNMNSFIDDEFRSARQKAILKLSFKPKEQDYYLNTDMISYLVSQLQRELEEFHCIGILVP